MRKNVNFSKLVGPFKQIGVGGRTARLCLLPKLNGSNWINYRFQFWVQFYKTLWYSNEELSPLTSKYIDTLMACTNCLVCFISTVNGRIKKKEKEKRSLGSPALVAGT